MYVQACADRNHGQKEEPWGPGEGSLSPGQKVSPNGRKISTCSPSGFSTVEMAGDLLCKLKSCGIFPEGGKQAPGAGHHRGLEKGKKTVVTVANRLIGQLVCNSPRTQGRQQALEVLCQP